MTQNFDNHAALRCIVEALTDHAHGRKANQTHAWDDLDLDDMHRVAGVLVGIVAAAGREKAIEMGVAYADWLATMGRMAARP